MIDTPSSVSVPLKRGRDYAIRYTSLRDLPGILHDVGLRTGKCVVVTDENVGAQYRSPVRTALSSAGWIPHVITVPPGEKSKSADQLQVLYDDILEWGIDRDTPVIALGGGVVGDLAGYAAATLLRGVPVVQCPTSLIAHVDSALGGKTGINHATGKNLIGAFHQPNVVVADLDTLGTLPQREWTSGMAEVIKHAVIADADLFSFIEEHLVDVMTGRRRDLIHKMIPRAAKVKAEIVAEDEKESGRRAILNFGHTFAHAIESVAGYGTFTHGEAVAIGMRAALFLSAQRNTQAIPRENIDYVLRAIPQQHDPSELDWQDVRRAMQSDKKNKGDVVRFVLLDRLGQAYVTGDISDAALRQAWDFATRP
ncbi:3-dehydroquinate synthase [Longibacter salinarum]|uniref:3-dehydroquinate synthase n=1 Tax=Longibacter salinarum TaxID=1850348 RepID=A0A2A8D2S4_9BACT|nr:3-dehydroquinate synthase [Longibacter salinarum]PEN15246.1 3-dehydroquinate synthase [Longibacter salinarum]